ncbi:MAG: patatin-like phospholipase family protein, partial [Planctomycetota bacterium]
YPVFKQLLFPRYGSGDTYASHFDRVYYRGRVLNETGPPLLILNTTRYSDGTRKAFRAETDRDVLLARVVAASGAFPVAFDPVRIGDESYVDGGVVENLGIGGLQHYFRDHAGDADLADRLPGVLIISDVSLIPDDPPSWKKPSLLQMAIHAQHASYFAMHQWIYSFYTDGAYDRMDSVPLQQPYAVQAGRLWPDLPPALKRRPVKVFVLSPASPAERRHYEGDEDLVDAVSALETLQELDPDEVDAAFWIGARLAQVYIEDICAAAGGRACRPVEIPDTPPVPRSLEQLFRSPDGD